MVEFIGYKLCPPMKLRLFKELSGFWVETRLREAGADRGSEEAASVLQPKDVGGPRAGWPTARVGATVVWFPRWESLGGPGCCVDMTPSRHVERSVGEAVCAGVCSCEL